MGVGGLSHGFLHNSVMAQQLYAVEVWLAEEEIATLDQACEMFGLCAVDSHSWFIRRCLIYGLLSLRDADMLGFPDAETPEFVFTTTGALRCVVVLSPSWPSKLSPHAAKVPSEQSARLWWAPAPIATTVLPKSAEPEAVSTATGTVL